MLAGAGVAFTGIVTAFDLIAIAIKSGLKFICSAPQAILKFIGACAKAVGMTIEISQQALNTLLTKMMFELKIAAKLAMVIAAKTAKSKEFEIILKTAAIGSIGLLII